MDVGSGALVFNPGTTRGLSGVKVRSRWAPLLLQRALGHASGAFLLATSRQLSGHLGLSHPGVPRVRGLGALGLGGARPLLRPGANPGSPVYQRHETDWEQRRLGQSRFRLVDLHELLGVAVLAKGMIMRPPGFS